MSDDKKDAVTIGVTLSSQLITAALAMIAVIGTFSVFIIDKREVGLCYTIIIGIAFISFIVSIICGGRGINKVREDGFTSNWNLKNSKKHYNRQAILCLVGIIFFIISVFLGKEKSDISKQNLLKETETIKQLRISDSVTKKKIRLLELKIDSLEKQQSQKELTPPSIAPNNLHVAPKPK
ncbi:MAG: hypothetical protein EOP47_11405 [Sphingobacteriaceae bacterium]|nr:MAG: hypothetical protein EOP47_11405 [Sphingobacteriaceae bacterium]